MFAALEVTTDINVVTAVIVLVAGSAAGIALADLGKWLYRQLSSRHAN